MKNKNKCIFMAVLAAGILGGLVFFFRFLQNHFDDYNEDDLFEDTDLDYLDEEEIPKEESPAKEEKKQKVRRGYIPIKFHTAEEA